jgi:hypothetical protein
MTGARFELARVNHTADLESAALTTRPPCQLLTLLVLINSLMVGAYVNYVYFISTTSTKRARSIKASKSTYDKWTSWCCFLACFGPSKKKSKIKARAVQTWLLFLACTALALVLFLSCSFRRSGW